MRMPATTARVPTGPQRVLAKGEELFAEGDDAEYFYKVVSGAIRTYKLLSDGRRQIDAFHLEGDIFGLESRRLPPLLGRGGRRRRGRRLSAHAPRGADRRGSRRSATRSCRPRCAASSAPRTTCCCSAARPPRRRSRPSCSTWRSASPKTTSISSCRCSAPTSPIISASPSRRCHAPSPSSRATA